MRRIILLLATCTVLVAGGFCASGNHVVLRTLGTLYCIGDPEVVTMGTRPPNHDLSNSHGGTMEAGWPPRLAEQ